MVSFPETDEYVRDASGGFRVLCTAEEGVEDVGVGVEDVGELLVSSSVVVAAGVVELLVSGMVLDVGACVDVVTLALVLVVCVAPCDWSGREKRFSVKGVGCRV